jgi:hypothetical protein
MGFTNVHERTDAPHPRLLRLRKTRPHGSGARRNTEKFPPLHARPHVQETASYRFTRAL